jgi:hypothetical protein
MDGWLTRLRDDGFALLPAVFSSAEMEKSRAGVSAALTNPTAADSILASVGQPPHGARNLLRIWPGAISLARSPALAGHVLRVIGPAGLLVRGLYFDKPPGEGWALPWHRDTAIAVRSHGTLGRFRKPTVKSGVPHVDAPAEVLRDILVARIHLDDMTDDNGPLRVLPGSHRLETTAADEAAAVTLRCRAGDVLFMRPLLLHSSGLCAASHRGHRRVVHLEFAPGSVLPDGYEWHAAFPLAT